MNPFIFIFVSSGNISIFNSFSSIYRVRAWRPVRQLTTNRQTVKGGTIQQPGTMTRYAIEKDTEKPRMRDCMAGKI